MGVSKGKPRCALKLDLTKDFDSVRCDFILHTMTVMGFSSKFLNWIKACLTSPCNSIQINGCSEGFSQWMLWRFFPRKKRCQTGRSPFSLLSPYLFVICIETLSQLINQATTSGRFKYRPKCSKIGITHLCFANDLFIFCEASASSLNIIKKVMNRFYSLFGLKVSPFKQS